MLLPEWLVSHRQRANGPGQRASSLVGSLHYSQRGRRSEQTFCAFGTENGGAIGTFSANHQVLVGDLRGLIIRCTETVHRVEGV